MKTSVGKTALEIFAGDITTLHLDAIANAANSELWMGAGVAGAIKHVGGEIIEQEAMRQGPVEIGAVVVTGGHALPAKHVLHAVVMGVDLQTSGEAIKTATYNALAAAERHKLRSLAMPAFGTGVGGFPVYECARLMLAETVRYLSEHPKSRLRLIVFCAYDAVTKAAFTHAFIGIERP
ncbi:MAG: macro domain-containing protein [Thermoleophilia bacterium]